MRTKLKNTCSSLHVLKLILKNIVIRKLIVLHGLDKMYTGINSNDTERPTVGIIIYIKKRNKNECLNLDYIILLV